MDAWMEGMKDVLEPAFVLLLAWALGDVIGAVRTAEWIAQAPRKYLITHVSMF